MQTPPARHWECPVDDPLLIPYMLMPYMRRADSSDCRVLDLGHTAAPRRLADARSGSPTSGSARSDASFDARARAGCCGGAPEAGETTSSTSTAGSSTTELETTTLPATTVPADTPIAQTTATTELESSTLPATTAPAATSTTPTTSAVPPMGASLRSILEPYEHAAIVDSNGYWQAFEFDRCWRLSPSRRDAGDPAVDQQDVVARGDEFDCYLRTDPPADVLNNFYVIVLDDSGTAWANGAGTDGSFFLPAIPSGLLCREYLAHPDFIPSMGDHGPGDPAQDSWWIDNDGQRAEMDVDHDGIHCELLFDPATVARVWAGNKP